MTIDEAIKHCEEMAHQNEILMKRYDDASGYNRSHDEKIRTSGAKGCEQLISLYRQLAEWLKELKESRMVLDILGQFLADMGTDICCEDLIMEDDYCEKYCENQKPLCWYRWAKMKERELNADDNNVT